MATRRITTTRRCGLFSRRALGSWDVTLTPRPPACLVQAPPKQPEISNAMRERLINESRGLGADPGSKNPFLLVFFGVGVFVVLGALAVNI